MATHPSDQTVETDQVSIYFTNGSGTLYRLDNLPVNAVLGMPVRDQALAKALLELSLTNVDRAEAL